MASKTMLLMLLMMIAVIVIPAFATDYVVGDDDGWGLGYNYTEWIKGKKFFVGDTLLFKYTVGKHNVFKVNETAYEKCLVPSLSEALTSGKDKITLETTGKKWYLCGFELHCDFGMKIEINVLPTTSTLSPSPSPSPTPAPAPAPAPAPVSVLFPFRDVYDKTMKIWTNWRQKNHY